MNDLIARADGHLFSRDGHLTMLTLDRFDAGELAVDGCEDVIEHVRTCGRCSSRLEDVQEFAGAMPGLRPPVAGRIEPQRGRMTAVAVASSLAAALLVLLAWPQPEQASRISADSELTASPYTTTTATPEEFDASNVELRAFAGTTQIRGLDYVPADADVTLEVSASQPGYVALLKISERAEEEGGTDGTPDSAVEVLLPVAATSGPTDGRREVRLRSDPIGYGSTDSTRLVAVYCPSAFDHADAAAIVGGSVPSECDTTQLDFTWVAEAADS